MRACGTFAVPCILLLAHTLTFAEEQPSQHTTLHIVTHMPKEISTTYGKWTRRINAAYAQRHGYSFTVDDKDYTQGGKRDPRWSKVQVMLNAMERKGKAGRQEEHEIFMWMDIDAIFSNFEFQAHTLLEQVPAGSDLLICKDLSMPKERVTCGPTCLNTGAFLLRNTQWSHQLLREWWDVVATNPQLAFRRDYEESALAHLYKVNWNGIRNKTHVFRPTAFNSIAPFHQDHDPAQLVLHASGEPDVVRELVFKRVEQALQVDEQGTIALNLSSVLDDLPMLVKMGYEKAHKDDPNNAQVAAVLASIVRTSGGDRSLARDLMRRAMQLAPQSADMAVAYGSLAAQVHGDWCEAASAFLAASRLSPESQTNADLLINANHRCADETKARKSREQLWVFQVYLIVAVCLILFAVMGRSLLRTRGDGAGTKLKDKKKGKKN